MFGVYLKSGSQAGLPYLPITGNKIDLFSFHNNPKNLDKMDLGLWDCFGRVKLVL